MAESLKQEPVDLNMIRETMNENIHIKTGRITSIDALRAITLLGIITVHAFDGFGRGVLEPSPGIDEGLTWFVKTFL